MSSRQLESISILQGAALERGLQGADTGRDIIDILSSENVSRYYKDLKVNKMTQ